MTAPAPTARTTPGGNAIIDGYQTLITFAADPDVSIWEKTVKPPGIDGGDKIDITTMHNEELRTFAARSLKTLTDGSSKVAYDAAFYEQAKSLVNVETAITITFRTGDTLVFYGYLQKFEADDLAEGSQPEATVSFVATNRDPVTGAEEDYVFTANSPGSGT